MSLAVSVLIQLRLGFSFISCVSGPIPGLGTPSVHCQQRARKRVSAAADHQIMDFFRVTWLWNVFCTGKGQKTMVFGVVS
jgi:hypothetical protein